MIVVIFTLPESFAPGFLGVSPFFSPMYGSSLYIRYTDSVSCGRLDRKRKSYSDLV